MIKTPEIPTDNLYKFASIFGLIIFIFSIYLMIQHQIQFNEELSIFRKNHNTLLQRDNDTSNKKWSIEEKKRFQETLIRKKYDLKLPLNFENISRDIYEDYDFQKDYFALNELNLEMKTLIDEERRIMKEYDSISEEYNSITIWGIGALFILSMFFLNYGFYNWYHKAQKLYDKQIQISSVTPEKLLRKIQATDFFHKMYYYDKKNISYINDYSEYLERIHQSISFYRSQIEELLEKYASVLELDIIKDIDTLNKIAIKIEQEKNESNSFEEKDIENFIQQLEVLKKLFIDYVV